MLGYKIDLYFHDYKIAVEIDENGHNDRNIDHEIKGQKVIKQKLICEFIRIDRDKENIDIFKDVNKIFRYIKQSSNKLTKKCRTDKISLRLLKLALKSNNTIKSKTTKNIVKKYYPIISNVV